MESRYVYCFQETKLEGEVAEMVKQIWPNKRVRFGCLEVSGTRGGIIILWDSRVWKGEVVKLELTL